MLWKHAVLITNVFLVMWSCSIKAYIIKAYNGHELCFGCLFAKCDPATLMDWNSASVEKLEVGVKSCRQQKTLTRTWHTQQTILDQWIKGFFKCIHMCMYSMYVCMRKAQTLVKIGKVSVYGCKQTHTYTTLTCSAPTCLFLRPSLYIPAGLFIV